MWKDWNPFILLLGMQNSTATLGNSSSVAQMVKQFSCDQAIHVDVITGEKLEYIPT